MTAAEDKANRLERQAEKRDAEIERLRASLERYGAHDPMRVLRIEFPDVVCTCGLLEALSPRQDKEPRL